MSKLRNHSFSLDSSKLAVIGLGYVGLPLAVEFGRQRKVIGFDVNTSRINELRLGYDATHEVSQAELSEAALLEFSSSETDLDNCNVFIVTVPTPIDKHKRPDLSPLIRASEVIGKRLKPGDVVIYESTVYPGATEDDCVPVLERNSGLIFNEDFFCGYSPERINPGDKLHRLPDIKKITAASTNETAIFVDKLYASIITVGTHRAPSIKVAEAAKVIENTQRDLNIALINEFSKLFEKLNIDTEEVLLAAGTKWNFLPFRPGLVGGHCIGVDPYYLTHKAQSVGYYPELILAGRRINESIPDHVAAKFVKKMCSIDRNISGARVLILGATFKENCPDVRNSLSFKVKDSLEEYGLDVSMHDPLADPKVVMDEYNVVLNNDFSGEKFDGLILTVPHKSYIDLGIRGLKDLLNARSGIFFDMKSVFPIEDSDLRL